MTKTTMLNTGAIGIGLLMTITALLLPANNLQAVVAADKPNVLFIMIDDLNDYVGALGGHPQAYTPNIDAFLTADDTTNFTNAHTPAPSCNPSRSAIMSGLSPKTTGIVLNKGRDLRDYSDTAQTMNQYFSSRGHHSVSFGKIDHTVFPSEWDEIKRPGVYLRAFQAEAEAQNVSLDLVPSPLGHGNFDWGPVPMDEEYWPDYQIASDAISFLEDDERSGDPFFLAVGILKPHLPWHCPAEYFDLIVDDVTDIIVPDSDPSDLDDVGPIAASWANDPNRKDHEDRFNAEDPVMRQGAVHAYLACTSFADAQVGRVLEALENSEHADNTIVVVVSDHGWFLGEKNTWKKFKLWEDATQVPFGIHVPSQYLKSGVANPETSTVVNIASIYQTLAGLVFNRNARTDYASLVKLLDESTENKWINRPALTYFGSVNNVSMRRANFRYTQYEDGFVEFYDHRVDAEEKLNLAFPEYYANNTSMQPLLDLYDGSQSDLDWINDVKIPESAMLLDRLGG